MMHFTTNQLSLTAFVAVAFKQLFLHLVKDQLSIKTSVRWFAEDSSQPPVTKSIKLVSPVCHCDSHPLFQMGKPWANRPPQHQPVNSSGLKKLVVLIARWETFVSSSDSGALSHSWAAEQLLLQLLLASAGGECVSKIPQSTPVAGLRCTGMNKHTHTPLSSLCWKWMGKTSEEWAERQDLALGTAFETRMWVAVPKKQRKLNIWTLSLEGFWAGDEANEMQLESIHENCPIFISQIRILLGNRHQIYSTLRLIRSFSASALL